MVGLFIELIKVQGYFLKANPGETMTPHQYMSKHLRKLPEGGIAWNRRIFTSASTFDPVNLVDAAVDIAWSLLMPNALERPALVIKKEGRRIVFRIDGYSLEQVLAPVGGVAAFRLSAERE